MSSLSLIIASPTRTWFDGPADSVHLSTDLGEMEVFPGHVSLLGTVTVSKVRVRVGDHEDEFLVRRGFIAVEGGAGDTVRVTASHCERRADMDLASIKDYREFILGLLAKREDLSQYQIGFLEDEHGAIEKLMTIEKTES